MRSPSCSLTCSPSAISAPLTSVPLADPGISRLHAVLIAVPAGHWAVLDPGSANGTLVNGAEIAIGEQVRLQDGDRINLGAWTAITVHRDDHLEDARVGR